MRAISWCDMIALEVQGDVLECLWVPVDVQCPDGTADFLSVLLGSLDLAQEILREI